MPVPSNPPVLFQALSGFWQRFFADADQVKALCQGSELLLGQAYLDLVSATVAVSLQDAVAFDKELYTLVVIDESEVAFQAGATTPLNAWNVEMPTNPDGAPFVTIPTLDNTTFEPTASLEYNIDYELTSTDISFVLDPTDTTGTGTPLPGFAYRTIDVSTGGLFTDTTVDDWQPAMISGVMKGDSIRILSVGTNGSQRKYGDYPIVLVREEGLYVSASTPLPTQLPEPINYVILRVPANNQVTNTAFTLNLNNQAFLPNTRIDQGSLTIFAQGPTGALVQENVDYAVNYESGTITALTTWLFFPGPYTANYTYRVEQYPATGPSPRLITTGEIVSGAGTITPALQMSFWIPDGQVDRMTLSNNFGSMIGVTSPSSEAYRGFLQGIFALYIMGPVLDSVEAALNVVMGFSVVQTTGEIFQSIDTSDPAYVRVLTTSPITGLTVYYTFPAGTPIRTDLVAGDVLTAFEVLTTAVSVTDYVQSPSWFAGQAIPTQLFTPVNGQYPTITQRTSSPIYILNVVNPVDQACVGDPGVFVGTDEYGFNADTLNPGQPVFRHRVAYVLWNQYLKFQCFYVTFNAAALATLVGSAFPQSVQNLNDLVIASRPSYTYAVVAPSTTFGDLLNIIDYPINFARLVGSRIYGPDQVIFTDSTPTVSESPWLVGAYYHFEEYTPSVAFPSTGVPVSMPDAPASPRFGYLNRVWVDGTIGGLALRENVDYTVDHANETITRLTSWDSTTVTVNFMQANVGNLANAALGASDMPLLVGGVDPVLLAASYGTVYGWDGTAFPATQPRDISLIERPLQVYIT